LESDPISFLAQSLIANNITEPLNVRQGAFKLINAELAAWRRWRPLVYASIAVLAGYIVINAAIGAWLNHRADTMHAQSVTLYRELFPQDKRIVNLQQQLLSHLGKGSSSEQAAFFSLFGQLANAIKSTPSDSSKPAVQLRSLTFDTNNGMLQVDIVMPSVSWLDALQKQLATADVSTQVQSLAAEPNAMVGRLRLSNGGNRNAR
jgi:general secretion pathway protein L